MKNIRNFCLLLAGVIMMSLSSCIKDELAEPVDVNDVLANVEAQAQAVESSVKHIDDLQELIQPYGLDADAMAEKLQTHAKSLSKGISLEEGSLATLKIQGELASLIGSAQAELYREGALDSDAEKLFASLEKSVRTWLGELFVENYSAAVIQAKVEAIAEELSQEIKKQELSVDALASDVEAGLRKDADPKALAALSESLASRSSDLKSFRSGVASTATQINKEYSAAIRTAVSDPAAIKTAEIKTLNEAAQTQQEEVGTVLSNLAAEIAQCKTKLEELQKRLEVLEDSIEGLLDLIQSVTFLSERSDENAVAYYSMDVNTKVSDENLPYYGKAKRTAAGTMELNYIVRPAAAATALNANLDAVSVMGYYANSIALMGVDPTKYVDFEVTKVVATDANRGLVTVTVTPNLKEEFYYKEIGAKCALSIKTGKTDITSKFVEIVPMDNSAEVYVTSITPSEKYIEISKGETFTLSAAVLPEKATNKAYSMAASDSRIVSYDPNTGIFTAAAAGEAVVTVTSHGTDEWGLPLVAECKVKVNEAFRLSGPPYVEVGYTADLFLDYPASAIVESKVWMSSDTSKATVDQSGKVTGVGNTYLSSENDYGDVTISCTINGVTTVSHSLKVVVTQPKSIRVANLADNQNSISMKVDHQLSLASTIYPETVDSQYFRLYYSSDQGLGWINNSNGFINEYGNRLNPGTAWVYIDVKNSDKTHYFAPGASLRRTVIVKVEPYYVKSLSFAQEIMKLAPGQTAVLAPSFTSDVEGKQPTYTGLKWTSSNPSVVSVNEATGEIVTYQEGSAIITATTADSWAVPGGEEHKSASCTIVVETPVAPINVGDFYYTDGTWSSERDYSKTVLGIVFYNSPVTSDSKLMTDYPEAIHGLVVSLKEYNDNLGYISTQITPGDLSAMGCEILNENIINGYSNTKGLGEYSKNKGYVSGYTCYYAELFNPTEGVLNQHKVATPAGTSSWYIPSYYEMQQLYQHKAAINSALNKAGGNQLSEDNYWISSFKRYGAKNEIDYCYPFDMSTGKWSTSVPGGAAYYNENCPVRVVFAF